MLTSQWLRHIMFIVQWFLIFIKISFQEFIMTQSTLSLVKHGKLLSFSLIITSSFILSDLRFFHLDMYGKMHTVFRCSQQSSLQHSFVCSAARDIPIFQSSYPVDVLCIVLVPSFLIRQYISHCASNLTGIRLINYLVVVLAYIFDREFVGDFIPM